MSVISIAHGAPEPQPEPEPGAAGGAIAAALVDKLVTAGLKELEKLMKNSYEDDVMKCFFNNWKARDTAAQAYCTYNGGRFSKDRKFWGIRIGTWYCAYNKAAGAAKGLTC